MHYQTHTLTNGLRLIHLPVDSPVAYCGFAVNCGARDERTGEFGMAHFTEHMLFKGTEKRKSWHILNRMESIGGELNAYTTKEETIVYSIFPEQYMGRAIELLGDLVFHSVFPAREVEKEKDVILDEISSYKDNPAELIYDEFENLLFDGHELGHFILGEENDLERFTPENGRNFLTRQYRPENMVFFSMGKTDLKKIIRLVETSCGKPTGPFPAGRREAPGVYNPARKKEKADTFQTHTVIGNRAYPSGDKRRPALLLLNNILGGPGMNSRLNLSLREKRGYVYTVESAYTPYTDAGVFSVYFGTDPKNADTCFRLVLKELRKCREQSLSALRLHAAKRQFMGQLEVSSDNHENIFLGLGKTFLHTGNYLSLKQIYEKIEAVTAADLLAAANETFDENKLSWLIYS